MTEFEKIIAQTLRRLRKLETEHRELANALPKLDARHATHIKNAERAAQAINEVSQMYSRMMGS